MAITVVFVLLAANVAPSTVIVLLSRDTALVATDSKSRRVEGGIRSVCKIGLAGTHTLFAATGTGAFEEPAFDPYSLAIIAAADVRTPSAAAERYVKLAQPSLTTIWYRARDQFLQHMTTTERVGPQDFVFLMATGSGLMACSGSFVEASEGSLRVEITRQNPAPGELLAFSMGATSALPPPSEIYLLAQRLGAPKALEELILRQAHATPAIVGGPTTIVRLSSEGSVTWLARGACSP